MPERAHDICWLTDRHTERHTIADAHTLTTTPACSSRRAKDGEQRATALTITPRPYLFLVTQQRMQEQAQAILNSLYEHSSYSSASARGSGSAARLLASASARGARGRVGVRRGGVERVGHLEAADASGGMQPRRGPAPPAEGGAHFQEYSM